MQNLIICCDGTWNTPDNMDDGVPAPTNVVRICNSIAELDASGRPQHTYYHPGVGTDGSWWDRAIAGGTGRGLDRNIMSAYRWLCDHWQDGAQVYLFGFSRGAYTVRSLVGFISACGLLKLDGLREPEIWERIERLFQRGYRPRKTDRKKEKRANWDALGWEFHNAAGEMIPIRFLGVWDTVGALGIPDDMAFLNLIDRLHDHSFHDTRLSPAIQTARHAVAMDEMRASFQPTLWTAYPSTDAEQVWFPGVHADVGGGYRECGLSDGALWWMIEEARKVGLVFDDGMVAQVKPNHLDMVHDSARGVFAMLPLSPRSVPRYSDTKALHSSALDRIKTPPITQSYRRERPLPADRPAILDIFARQPWNDTGVWLEAGVEYRFTAKGEWQDGTVTCGPGGTADGNFQPAEVLHLLASALGRFERVLQKITGNQQADIQFTKRHEDFPWFALVGSIANGGVDPAGKTISHESFLIGTGCTYTPKKSGYFYAYANDAWNCYGNNRGKVELQLSHA